MPLGHSPSCWRGLSGLGVPGAPARPDRRLYCRDGLPYCEADYHTEFGIRCDGCEKYITGHVLEVRRPAWRRAPRSFRLPGHGARCSELSPAVGPGTCLPRRT